MDKMLLIFKNELRTFVLRKSFLFVLLLGPAVGLILTLVINSSSASTSDGSPSPIAQFFSPEINRSLEGYVDLSGKVVSLPEHLADRLKPYPSEEAAAEAHVPPRKVWRNVSRLARTLSAHRRDVWA